MEAEKVQKHGGGRHTPWSQASFQHWPDLVVKEGGGERSAWWSPEPGMEVGDA